tara:strand:+ start:174 stop:629 length:456 start_codon:yes stop_codon:yes gene_type:complete
MTRLSKKNKSIIIDALLRQGEMLEIDVRESITSVPLKYDVSADALSKEKDTEPSIRYRDYYSLTNQSDEWKKMYQDLLDLSEAILCYSGYQIDIYSVEQEIYNLNQKSLDVLEYQIAQKINPELTHEDFKNTFGLTERENLQVEAREMLND